MEHAILARHGETEFSVRGAVNGDPRGDCPLTATGRNQARRLGLLLGDTDIGVCVTSEFPRTMETADLALDGRAVPRIVLRELNDPRPGVFEDGQLADYRAWARGAGSADRPPGGGESRRELLGRYVRGYRKVLARREETVLVVGHSLPSAYALEALAGRDPAPVIPLVPYAEPHHVRASDLRIAVERLEAWLRAPTW